MYELGLGEDVSSIPEKTRELSWYTDELRNTHWIRGDCRVRLKLAPTQNVWKSRDLQTFLCFHYVVVLDISGTNFDSFEFLRYCHRLERFYAEGTDFSDVRFLRRCSNLRVLDLSDTEVVDFSRMPVLSNLEMVDFRGVGTDLRNVGGASIGNLCRFPRLREMWMDIPFGELVLSWDVDVNSFPIVVHVDSCQLTINEYGRITMKSDMGALRVMNEFGTLTSIWDLVDTVGVTVLDGDWSVESMMEYLGIGEDFFCSLFVVVGTCYFDRRS